MCFFWSQGLYISDLIWGIEMTNGGDVKDPVLWGLFAIELTG